MAQLLFLAHRLPYPPNKGDKVRSFHLLQHLARRHRVFVGTFVDDLEDWAHVDTLRARCADLCARPLHPRRGRVRSLAGLATGQALTLRYYADAGLQRWVRELVARERIDAVVVFSSSMAQYALPLGLPVLADLVDVDSAKWRDYAPARPWPLSWLYRREADRLLACERAVVQQSRRAFLVTEREVALFESLAPEARGRLSASGNGVDAAFFSPDPQRPSPFEPGERPVVFTGAMDYWPNEDAVSWFCAEVLPALRQRHPGLRLHIVGRSPTAAVQALAGEAVRVTGTVPDVRPYLQHAAVVVAPLRLARGVQNKVLEAMAMGRPVVAAASCVSAIDARPGQDLLAADSADDHVQAVDRLLRDPGAAARIGRSGRDCVLRHYSWDARLAGIERAVAEACALAAPAATPPAGDGTLIPEEA